METTEKFDSTIMIPGFGEESIPAARAVHYVIENASSKGLHVRSITVARGQLILRGEAEVGCLKTAITELSREISMLVRAARNAPAIDLPRTAEGT